MKLFVCLFTLLLSGGDSFVSPLAASSSSSFAFSGHTSSGSRSRTFEATLVRARRATSGGDIDASVVSMAASRADARATTVASWALAALLLVGTPLLAPSGAAAISGGGLDYSGLNLTGKDFSMGKYKSKDFSGAIAKEVSFKGSDLRGVRFFKADLKKADFTGANLGTASLEEADLEGTVLTNVVATGSYFGNNIGNVGDISGADFTDALIRKDVAKALCGRPDAKGTNPTTGTDTRDSLLCDMF